MKTSLDQIKKLRAKTKVGVMDCRQALEAGGGDLKKAEEWLRKKGFQSAGKRAGRETGCGLVEAYTHAEGKIVAVVELCCETDFVARTEDFKKLAHELAMQVAALNPKDVQELLAQPWIRDESKKIDELVKELSAKTGENIKVGRLSRLELGKES
ncbi:translation elongation factor Ts [Patescibacteria group bacterium]|nr:translation elongation factor Ts [Patescibacteria group bacterium]